MDDDIFDDIHDVPLLVKGKKRLYEGSRTDLLSPKLLLVNMKVVNGLSNTCCTLTPRYVICFITYWY